MWLAHRIRDSWLVLRGKAKAVPLDASVLTVNSSGPFSWRGGAYVGMWDGVPLYVSTGTTTSIRP